MTLHTVNKPPLGHSCMESCLRLITDGDALVLLEDGVYHADNHFSKRFHELPENIPVYVVKADLEARGLQQRINPRFQVIDDGEFVDLCVMHPKMQSWY